MKHLWEFVAYIYDDAFCCVVVFVVFCEGHILHTLDRGRMIVVILADVFVVHINFYVVLFWKTGALSVWIGIQQPYVF